MKLQMCLVLGLAVLLDICLVEAKPQVQNCAFSNCNQNNFGRRRRQILEEILAEVEADEDAKVVKRQVQNCQGSGCTQNNLGPIAPGGGPPSVPAVHQPPPLVPGARPIAPGPVQPPPPVVQPPVVQPLVVQPPVVQPPPPVVGPALGGSQIQNCQESDCTQNNLGPITPGQVGAPGPVPAGFPFTPGFPFTGGFPFAGAGGAGGSQVQNCVGSQCTQNNLGRKKRQIAEAINALTTEVLEAEDKAVAEDAVDSVSKRDADAQSQNCFGSSCNQNNFGRRKREVIAALLEELL